MKLYIILFDIFRGYRAYPVLLPYHQPLVGDFFRWHHYTSPKHDTECSEHLGKIDGRNPRFGWGKGMVVEISCLGGGRTRKPTKKEGGRRENAGVDGFHKRIWCSKVCFKGIYIIIFKRYRDWVDTSTVVAFLWTCLQTWGRCTQHKGLYVETTRWAVACCRVGL